MADGSSNTASFCPKLATGWRCPPSENDRFGMGYWRMMTTRWLFIFGRVKTAKQFFGASFDQTCWRYQSAMFDIVWLVRACRMNASHHITHHKLQPNQAPILQPVCHHAGICRYPLFFLEWFQGKRTGNCLFWWTHHRGSCRCFHETTYNDF